MFRVGDLIDIVSAGGGLELNAEVYSVRDLVELATGAAKKGTKITISLKNTRMSVSDLCEIANRGQGCIIFKDFYA